MAVPTISTPNSDPSSGIRRRGAARIAAVLATGGVALAALAGSPAAAVAASPAVTSCSQLLNILRADQAQLPTVYGEAKSELLQLIRDIERRLHTQGCPGW